MFAVTSVSHSNDAFSPDGTRIALLPEMSRPPRTPGVWVIDVEAATLTQLVGLEDFQVAVPSWVDPGSLPDNPALLIEELAWANGGDTLLVKSDNPMTMGPMPPVRNYFSVDARDGSLVYLADYEPFGAMAEFVQAVMGEPYFALPYKGIIAPDGETLFYISSHVLSQEIRPMYATPIPFGAEPVTVGEIPDVETAEAMLLGGLASLNDVIFQTAPNGRALVGTVLLTFEGG
jgi:hypothetical protein